ncbi:MAG: polysaccharide biosynthesis/export family protein [Geobacteraceae bacterium]|nr:polysaccharide biosynthesis/export family protein [Geobacteraceae bacterium]
MTSKAKAGSYVVGEGDKLQISVWGVASLNFEVKVRPDGMITVPGVGDVIASGRMPEELKKELTVKLKDLVKNPLVTVTVTDITNNKVFVFGSGTKPAVYDINRKTTLLQILCSLSDIKTADLKRAYLLRNREKVKVGFYMLFMLGDIEQDMQIEPNDSIFIPQHTDKNVYVVGGVNNPKAIEYREGLSVMEAILESGGFSKFASPDETRVVRKEDGHDLIIAVKGKKLIRNVDFSQNVKLKPGDFVIVDESIF